VLGAASLVCVVGGNVPAGFALATAAAGITGTAGRVRRRGVLSWEPHLLGLLLWSAATFMARRAGGTAAPIMFAFAVLPGVMALFLDRRAVLAWALLCGLPPVAFTLGAELLPPSQVTGQTLQTMRLLAPLAATAFVTLTTLAYQSIVTQRERSLLEARAAAEQARQDAEQARALAEQAREEAEQANRAKSAFLATMSHEIRTPLTAVVGLAELLKQQQTDPETTQQLQILSGAGRTLLGLVDDVLDVSRIESGMMQLEAVPVDLPGLAQDVAGILHARAAERGTILSTAHSGPGWICGDPLRLRQVLLNLVGNAVKFTEAGEIHVRSTARSRADGRLDLCLEVADTGLGIPADRQQAVLEAFTQADQSTSRSHGGSGLGLTIVVKLVELMGGRLALDSTQGVGTTITVRLVVDAAADQTTTAAPPAPSGAPLRVLLAEDNLVNQRVLQAQLVHLGCTVVLAGDGAAAVRATLEAEPPVHLVLMDCQMPVMDGFSATRKLRALGWTGPIVALTANASPQDRRACLDAGMDDFATKPVTLDELQQALAWARGQTRPDPDGAERSGRQAG
jgi:signal transduction histidine kinase/ActR/RegA family two-component response regulator